jgi:hypothetical protein
MRARLAEIGRRLGYQVEVEDGATPAQSPVRWRDSDGGEAYVFFVLASAVLGGILLRSAFPQVTVNPLTGEPGDPLPPTVRRFVALPGGRARLAAYKLRRDPHLKSVADAGWRFAKFRLLRWLSEQADLRRENLDRLLEHDPLDNRDPQLPLL